MILCALVLSVGLVGSAFAHKSQVVGEYKLEVGWEKEPPIADKQNSIEIMITRATASDMDMSAEEHAKHQKQDAAKDTKSAKKTIDSKAKSEKKTTKEVKSTKKTETKKTTTKKKVSGVTGITGLEVAVNLNDKKSFLEMNEDKKTPGRYYGAFTPDKEGHPTVHVYGKIEGSDVEATLHPEKVEPTKSK